MTRASVRRALMLGSLLPAILPLLIILRFAVDVPYLDQWHPDIAGMFIKAHDGTLRFADVLAQHHEHRILIPRLIYLLLGSLTNWNALVEMFAGWLVVCATAAGILWLNNGRSGDYGGRALFVGFLSNLLIFSPLQAENWLWGMGLTNFMPAAWFVAAICTACSKLPQWPKIALTTVLCAAATFSFGNGILSFPLVGLLVAGSESIVPPQSKRWALGSLLLGLIITLGLYLVHYGTPLEYTATAGLLPILHFNLSFLGNLFAYSTSYAPVQASTVAGTIMSVLFLVCVAYFLHVRLVRREFELADRMLVWIVIAGYAVLSGGLVSFSRAAFGISQATLSRYTSLSLYMPLALVQLVPIVCADLHRRWPSFQRPSIQAPAVLACFLIAFQLLSLRIVLNTCRDFQRMHRQGKAALLLMKLVPENPLIGLRLDASVPKNPTLALRLDEIGYIRPRMIADNKASQLAGSTVASASYGSAERIWQTAADQATVQGWAVLPDQRRPADAVLLTCDNAEGEPIIFTAAAELGLPQGDVSPSQSADRGYPDCGWRATFPLARLPAKLNVIVIRAWAFDGESGRAFQLPEPLRIHR